MHHDPGYYEPPPRSMDDPIEETNIGFQMLLKMGWVRNTGLGVQQHGRVEPIPIVVKNETLGLGRMETEEEMLSNATTRKLLESEKEETEDVIEQRKKVAEELEVREESLKEMNNRLYCGICKKQYQKPTELEIHLDSYDHHHTKRLIEARKNSSKVTRDNPDEVMTKQMQAIAARQEALAKQNELFAQREMKALSTDRKSVGFSFGVTTPTNSKKKKMKLKQIPLMNQ
eukprot:TRINITY_DN1562_c0_g1_i3.p1 TRINITY_DN1562_c0_g1~~TRINITY_DN1562_c0_g1_i3.p1  ORF type:complete len:229 (+),score=60.32 TRINITY_DN1562_c0_g1_i3:204-890(+)